MTERVDWQHDPARAAVWEQIKNGGPDHLAQATAATHDMRTAIRAAALAGHDAEQLAQATGLPLGDVHRILLADD